MVRCWYCPGCNEWGQRFQYGCRKCKRGQFKHRKCGNWVTAQYGFCPRCYPNRLLKMTQPTVKTARKQKKERIDNNNNYDNNYYGNTTVYTSSGLLARRGIEHHYKKCKKCGSEYKDDICQFCLTFAKCGPSPIRIE